MKKTFLSVMALAAMLWCAGCENQDLVRCRQDNQRLSGQLSDLQNQLTAANAALEKQKSENVDIQNKAMESITTMLKKEQAQREKLQSALDEKDALLKAEQQKLADALQQIDALKAENAKMKVELERLKAAATQAATK